MVQGPKDDSGEGQSGKPIQQVLDRLNQLHKFPRDQDWTSELASHLSVVSSDPSPPHPRVTYKYTVQRHHCNGLGNLHGGCTATLFDYCTSMAMAQLSKPGFWYFLGVSRTLNTTYLRPIPAGTECLIECEVIHAGKRLSALKGVIRRASDGAIMAICEHNKANNDPPLPEGSEGGERESKL